MSQPKDHGTDPERSTTPRKPYTTPQLTKHGTVQELTQAVGLSGNDGITGSSL